MEIYLDDLKEEKQKEVLKEMDLKNASDGNLEITPLFVLENEPIDLQDCHNCGKADCDNCKLY